MKQWSTQKDKAKGGYETMEHLTYTCGYGNNGALKLTGVCVSTYHLEWGDVCVNITLGMG